MSDAAAWEQGRRLDLRLLDVVNRILPAECLHTFEKPRIEKGAIVVPCHPDDLTYDMLVALAEALHTRAINFKTEGGWGGSENTPASRDEFFIIITGATL